MRFSKTLRVSHPGPITRWTFHRRGETPPTMASKAFPAAVVGLAFPYRFRSFHQAWAQWTGFFWLPCPECGEPYAGYEGAIRERRDPYGVILICRRCMRGKSS